MQIVSKADSNVDESFEDLLSKYKQIQLELECIRKEETMALEPQATLNSGPPPVNCVTAVQESLMAEYIEPSPGDQPPLQPANERKCFQAFNIKPLRQKLPTGANLDELKRLLADQENGGQAQGEREL